jgi:pyruvate dehydrogenase E1 component alpha subunit
LFHDILGARAVKPRRGAGARTMRADGGSRSPRAGGGAEGTAGGETGGAEGAMDPGRLHEIYARALLARRLEERIELLARSGEVPATLHSGAGQEVAQVAALAALRPDDPVLYGHRGVGYWVARDLPLEKILCDIAGREGGTNRGKGGVMHVVDPARAILGESGTLGGNFVIGAGVALAEQVLATGRVALVFFGDGTSNRGQFHETANFAALRRLPLILFCENNGWGLSLPVEASTSVRDIAARGAAYGIPSAVVDGADAEAVYAAVDEAARRARAGGGPGLIEAKLARIGPHYPGDRERYRPEADRAAARARDPLPRLAARLERAGGLDAAALEREIAARIEDAVAAFRARPPAAPHTALEGLYAP